MQITMSDTVMRDGKIIKITGKEEESKPKIISDTAPLFIQDENGKWVKNPDYVECDN